MPDDLASRAATKGGQKLVDMGDGRIIDFTGWDDDKIANWAANEKPTQFEQQRTGPKPGFFSNLGTATKNLVGGMLNMPTNPAEAAVAGGRLGSQIGTEDLARKQEGRSPAYRGVAAVGTAMGIPARQMEQAADIGDTAGVVGAAAPSVGMAVAPSLAARVPGAVGRLAQRVARGPGGYGEATINPATIASRELEARIPRAEPPDARVQMQTQLGQQQADAIARDQAAQPKPPMSKIPNTMPKPVTGPMSRIPNRMPTRPAPAPATATMSSAPGGSATLPPAPATAGPTSTGVPAGNAPVPLSSRVGTAPTTLPSRRIILPGEEIDPLARENAGSAAQATEADLRRLAAAGDRSAAVELTRRRLPQGPTDYSKMPLPRRIPTGESPNLSQRIATMEPESEIEMLRRGAGGGPTMSEEVAQKEAETAAKAETNRTAWENSQTRARQKAARDRAAAIREARP